MQASVASQFNDDRAIIPVRIGRGARNNKSNSIQFISTVGREMNYYSETNAHVSQLLTVTL